ncbi:MAG: Eco57I restriction-modification methylase domain-containing protein [Alphaproteobacteria bacterium]|nr:Eco57I restriction-modification methylase domain-containing protein [Alphaproteobacteria bacterium]
MNAKRQYGQFFTTNTDYILCGFSDYIAGKNVIDPFAGAGDLLHWALCNGARTIKGFDIDNRYTDNQLVFFNDSLRVPKKYEFVLTNPPYLYQNKLDDNTVLAESKHTDLYQLSLEKIMESEEGIVIVPINFLSSENAKYIRQMFLDKFEIVRANYFTEQVFADTTYNVIAFYYKKKVKKSDKMTIDMVIYPDKKKIKIELYENHNWQIGGEFLADIKKYNNRLKITRLEEEDLQNGDLEINVAYTHIDTRRKFKVDKKTYDKIKRNIIVLKAIDSGTDGGRIRLEDVRIHGIDGLVSIKTSRNQINLVFPDDVSVKEQEQIICLFNKEFEDKRNKYHSLFMTNYRDKDRKRISFNFAYNFINHLYFNKLKGGKGPDANLVLFE